MFTEGFYICGGYGLSTCFDVSGVFSISRSTLDTYSFETVHVVCLYWRSNTVDEK